MWVQTSFFIINMENNWINNEILVFAILMNKILRFIFKNQILKIFLFYFIEYLFLSSGCSKEWEVYKQ